MSTITLTHRQEARRRRNSRPKAYRAAPRKTAARVRAKAARARSGAIQLAAVRTVLFCAVAGATFMVSSLVGHVMVEKSRRDEMAAKGQMRLAVKSTARLEEQVYALGNVEALHDWAREHGYRVPEETVKPRLERTLVARR